MECVLQEYFMVPEGRVSIHPYSPAVKTVKCNKLIKKPWKAASSLKIWYENKEPGKTDERYHHTLKSIPVISTKGLVGVIFRDLTSNF